jgi:serine/threonine protein kinase
MSARRTALAPGTVLQGTYRIVRAVGAGGMGEVYEARHARLPGRFAIKVLTTPVAQGSPEFRRFQREAEIASSLRHPNIVQVVDFNQGTDGAPYIVMEFLDGADLGAVLERDGPLPPARALCIVEQVASALAAAHGQGVVHRDLKPQNVFLTPVAAENTDHAKVVDFGTSKVGSALTLTGETRLLGTPQYMAPEQAEGQGAAVDGRSDQFALAAMTYEMLSGRRPFNGENVPAILYKIAHESPPPLTTVAPGLPAAVDAVLQKALAKQKHRRFASVLEFAAALRASLGEGGAQASPAPGSLVTAPLPRPPRQSLPAVVAAPVSPDSGVVELPPPVGRVEPARRRPLRWLLIAVAVAVAAAALALSMRARTSAPVQPPAPAPAPPTQPAVVPPPVTPPAAPPSTPPAAAPSPGATELSQPRRAGAGAGAPVDRRGSSGGSAPALQTPGDRRPKGKPSKPRATRPRPPKEKFIVDF